jgi:hypothetical protein
MRHRERITPQPRQVDWREAGLSKPSAVRCRPATIRVEKINAVMGSLTDEDWERLQECLRRALDL